MKLVSSAALRLVTVPLGLAIACAAAGAQSSEIHHLFGPNPDGSFGAALAEVADVDGDGSPDLLIGAPGDSSNAGRAWLVAGDDGATIHDWSGGAGEQLGAAVASAGDVTGDGVPDVLVGAPATVDPSSGRATGAVHVYSGADGAWLRTYYGGYDGEEFGGALAHLGDLDGDGVDDHAIGGRDASYVKSGGGAVYLQSGATGAAIARIDGGAINDRLGAALAAMGDIDADGISDLAVGVPRRNNAGLTDCGAVYVYSGADQSVIFKVFGDQAQIEVGKAIAGGADLDGDGVNDLLVGATDWTMTAKLQGFVRAYSGATFAQLWEHMGSRTQDAMGAAVAMADRDGDGVAEVLVTAGSGDLKDYRIERLAPASGLRLYQRPDPDGNDAFGGALLILGDVNGDGAPDVAIGAPDADVGAATDEGRVTVFAGSDLWLDADPKEIPPSTNVTTTIGEGAPGNFTIRFVWDVNGTLVVLPLPPLSTFDAQGFASFVEFVPAGLSGISASLRAFAILANGKIGITNDETISFL